MKFDIDLMSSLFDKINEGILVADVNGKIIYFNDSYSNFIGKDLDEVKSMKLTDLRPGAKLPEVIETAEPFNYIIRKEKEEEYFCNIYPIFDEGRVSGAISFVTFLTDAKKIHMRMLELEEKALLLSKRMEDTNGTSYTFDNIVTESKKGIETKLTAQELAKQDIDILIQGETGTGKELFAQSIHNASARKHESFIAINCSAFPKDILEAELFGYEGGSFTGSKKEGKIGLFEAANKGTIFLDEVSEMDINLQAKLLRVIQERKIRRIGSLKEKDIDIRIIYACNVDLKKYVEEKKFRKDLYFRISTIPLSLPALRDRKEDILLLADSFLKQMNSKLKKELTFSEEATELLMNYSWPGNIRELRNIVEFSAIMTKGKMIEISNFPEQIASATKEKSIEPLGKMVKEYEKSIIQDLLMVYGNSLESKKFIAERLKISLASLYNKLNF